MPILTLGGPEPCMYAVAKLMLSLKVKPDAEEMCDEKQTATVKVSNWERSDLHCGSCHRQKML